MAIYNMRNIMVLGIARVYRVHGGFILSQWFQHTIQTVKHYFQIV